MVCGALTREAFGGLGIARRTQEKLEGVADAESTARYRYIQVLRTVMDVSSTFQFPVPEQRGFPQREIVG